MTTAINQFFPTTIRECKSAPGADIAFPDVSETFNEIVALRPSLDPMFGTEISKILSVGGSAQKRSGLLIEKAVAAALSDAGYTVRRNYRMTLTEEAERLAVLNPVSRLEGLYIANGTEISEKDFDIVAINAEETQAFIVEIKRGGGSTESQKRGPIVDMLKAGAIQLQSHLRNVGSPIKSCRPVILDYLGRSGFPEEIRITGDTADKFFSAPVKSYVDATLNEMREYISLYIFELMSDAVSKTTLEDKNSETAHIIELEGGAIADARTAMHMGISCDVSRDHVCENCARLLRQYSHKSEIAKLRRSLTCV